MFSYAMGILTALTLMGAVCIGYYIGIREEHRVSRKPEPTEEDKDKQRRMSERNEGIDKVLNYTYEDAIKAKRGR